MSLCELVQLKTKQAMKSHDNIARDCLRAIMANAKDMTVNAGRPLTDDAVLKCIQTSVKQHNDSIKQFKSAGRDDLRIKEEAELAVLQQFMPKMLSEEETRAVIDSILLSIEATKKNFGKVMMLLPKEADKKIASRILNSVLR